MPTAICPICKKTTELLTPNNILVAPICEACVNRYFSPHKLTHANYFCRTFNIPFDPNRWLAIAEVAGPHTWSTYLEEQRGSDTPTTPDKWAPLDEEWEACSSYAERLSRVDRIRDAFMERTRLKWGDSYTFSQLLQLESLLTATLRAQDISNPLQVDAIKKACKISVELDKAIEAGDSKGIKELSGSYASFTKAAQIDQVIAATNGDVIGTVADLADYIEQCGGNFTYYDGATRDVVDRTIADLKEYIRTLVMDSTGLTTTLERIAESYAKRAEEAATTTATADLDIRELVDSTSAAANTALDNELAATDVDVSDLDEDDNYF